MRAAWGGRPASQAVERAAESRGGLAAAAGEDISEVSREIRVAPPERERWRREFLEGGQVGLKKKNRPGGELMRTRAKLGEMRYGSSCRRSSRKKGVRGRAEEALEVLGRVSPRRGGPTR